MSADNWGICPKCKKNQDAVMDRNIEKVVEAYGKIPEEAYLTMKIELLAVKKTEDTLRENYELGVNEDGKFIVNYRASCSVCHFKFSYRFSKDVM